MIDDAKVRQRILEYLPQLEPWRLEMEELDFGERVGCAVKVRDHLTVKLSTRAFDPSSQIPGTRFERLEGSIAAELAQRIKSAFLEQSDREEAAAEEAEKNERRKAKDSTRAQ